MITEELDKERHVSAFPEQVNAPRWELLWQQKFPDQLKLILY